LKLDDANCVAHTTAIHLFHRNVHRSPPSRPCRSDDSN
jgi:hypothetical protein